MRPFFSLLLIGWTACAPATQNVHSQAQPLAGSGASEQAKGMDGFSVSVRIEVLQPVGTRTLQPGGALYPGEQFTITAWADQPVYLYVVGYEPDGWSSLLFPRGRHAKIRGGERLRLPEGDRPYTANSNAGEFAIKVLATTQPIDDSGCQRLRLRCPLWQSTETTAVRSAEADETNKPPPPPPPDGVPRGQRDGILIDDAAGYALTAKSDFHGNALLTFPLLHAQR